MTFRGPLVVALAGLVASCSKGTEGAPNAAPTSVVANHSPDPAGALPPGPTTRGSRASSSHGDDQSADDSSTHGTPTAIGLPYGCPGNMTGALESVQIATGARPVYDYINTLMARLKVNEPPAGWRSGFTTGSCVSSELRRLAVRMPVTVAPELTTWYDISASTGICYMRTDSLFCDLAITKKLGLPVPSPLPPGEVAPAAPVIVVVCQTSEGFDIPTWEQYGSSWQEYGVRFGPVSSPAPQLLPAGARVSFPLDNFEHCWRHNGASLRLSAAPPPPPPRARSRYY